MHCEQGYDGVFCAIYKCCAKTDAGSPKEIALGVLSFLLAISAFVASIAGLDVGQFEAAGDGFDGIVDGANSIGRQPLETAIDAASRTADLLSNLKWSEQQETAAKKIQRRIRSVGEGAMRVDSSFVTSKLEMEVHQLKQLQSLGQNMKPRPGFEWVQRQMGLESTPTPVTTGTTWAKPRPESGQTNESNGDGQSRQNVVSQVNAIACTDDGSAGQQGLETVWTSPSQRSAECVAPSNLTASASATPAAMSMDNLVQTEMEAQLAGPPVDLPVDLAWLAVSSFLEPAPKSRRGSEALARARAAARAAKTLSRTDSTWV